MATKVICYGMQAAGNKGVSRAVGVVEADSATLAKLTFAAKEKLQPGDVGAIDLAGVTPNAKAAGTRGKKTRKYFACLWLDEATEKHDSECWSFLFETTSRNAAAKSLYLHRFCQNEDSVAQIREDFKASGFSFTLSDINAASLSRVVEQHIEEGTDGHAEYSATHCIIEVEDLLRKRRVVVRDGLTSRMEEIRNMFELFGAMYKSGMSNSEIEELLAESDERELDHEDD